MIAGVLCQRKVPLSTTQILMPLNFTSGFADTKNAHPITIIGSPVVNVGDGSGHSKWGNGALYTDGSNYLRIAITPTLDLSEKKPFTIECWVFANPYGAGGSAIFSMRTTSGFCPIVVNFGHTKIGNSALTAWQNDLIIQPSNETWRHFAIVGDGTNITIYRGGTSIAQVAHPDWPVGDGFLNIGHDPEASSWCYFNDVRISNSARYTTNFTPPIAPFTA
jgi:hypothetical protein